MTIKFYTSPKKLYPKRNFWLRPGTQVGGWSRMRRGLMLRVKKRLVCSAHKIFVKIFSLEY